MLNEILLANPVRPTWKHDFTTGLLPAGSTFTRASAGTYFDAAGVLQSAATDAARFSGDPLTGAPWGFLSEPQSTNAVAYSQAFTATGWTATELTVTDNAVVAADGTTTAASLVESSATAARLATFSTSIGVVADSMYGLSIFARNLSGSRWLQLSLGGGQGVNFHPATGAIGSMLGTGVAGAVARQLPNGWWRFSFILTALFTTGTTLRVYMVPAADSLQGASYAGNGTSSIAVWGLQYETPGIGVTSYIATAGAAATRGKDVLSLPLLSIPGWDATGGVLVAAYRLYTKQTNGNSAVVFYPTDGANQNVLLAAQSGTQCGNTQTGFLVRVGAPYAINRCGGGVPALFARRKQAWGWSITRAQMAHDGTLDDAAASDLAQLPVNMTTVHIGGDPGVDQLNGALESLAYYKGARSDAFVQAVSR